MKLETFINEYKQSVSSNTTNRLIDQNGRITIPVVVHIVHNGEALGVGRNIPTIQITNQIAVLNADFNRLNADRVNTPSVFATAAGTANIGFVLACIDPNGYYTTGINRVQSTTTDFGRVGDSDSPLKHTSQGGVNAWPTDRYLNIWVSNINSTGLGGYATFPADYQTNPDIDGVVVDYRNFGTGGNISSNFFNRGRTTTHEVGHWMNLFHIWGTGDGCGDDDFCGDTPQQADETPASTTPVFGFESLRSCGNAGDMFMNYMDYTADQFMNLFTNDQVTRMRAVFQTGGPRSGFIDNYFKIGVGNTSCALNLYQLKTPFCPANGSVVWSITGPATSAPAYGSNILRHVTPQSGVNGTAVLTASWNNFTDQISIPIGHGAESSTYNPNYNNSGNLPMTKGSVNMTSYNNWTYGQVLFAGATGVAKNWRLVSCNSCNPQTYFSGNGNTFGVYLTQPYAFATIRAEIPTSCGDRTVEYSFLGGYLNLGYTISPNPAENEITISASLPSDPNNRTGNTSTPAYEVQIFNSFNQLLKKTKVKKDDRNVTIDVSGFPSNQFYTIKLISDNDVQTKSFFKR